MSSRCPLVLSSSRLLLHRPLIVSLCRLVVVASSFVAPPSRPLVTPHSCPFVVLSLAALSPSHHTVWLLCRLLSRCRLVLLLSSHCAALSLSNSTGWLLRRLSLCRCLVLSSCRPIVLSSSSHCAALSLSHCTGWLLPRLSSRRRLIFLSCHTLVILSSSHCAAFLSSHRTVAPLSGPLVVLTLRPPLVVLRRLVAVLPLVAPPSCPLVVLPYRPLIERWLVVAWPPSNAAAAIERPPHGRHCTPSSLSTPTTDATSTTAAATCIVERFNRHALTKKEAAAPPRTTSQRASTAYFAGTIIIPATKESYKVYIGTSSLKADIYSY